MRRLGITRLPERLRNRVAPAGDCWEWCGKRDRGYGRVYESRGRYVAAHRIVYEILVGPIPEGLHLDHLCRNRACVNPEHLEPVTPAENLRRGLKVALRTHCKRGHEWTAENQYVYASGRRVCRVCKRARETGGSQGDQPGGSYRLPSAGPLAAPDLSPPRGRCNA